MSTLLLPLKEAFDLRARELDSKGEMAFAARVAARMLSCNRALYEQTGYGNVALLGATTRLLATEGEIHRQDAEVLEQDLLRSCPDDEDFTGWFLTGVCQRTIFLLASALRLRSRHSIAEVGLPSYHYSDTLEYLEDNIVAGRITGFVSVKSGLECLMGEWHQGIADTHSYAAIVEQSSDQRLFDVVARSEKVHLNPTSEHVIEESHVVLTRLFE